MQGAHASALHSQPATLHTRNAGVDRVRAILTLTPTLTLAPQEPVCCCISALGTPCGLTESVSCPVVFLFFFSPLMPA